MPASVFPRQPFSIENLGKPVASIIETFLKTKISSLTNTRDFPGMQPVSLDRSNVNRLLSEDYHVCEKSDGIRVLGFMIQKSSATGGSLVPSFFITDRKYHFREIEGIAFPSTEAGDCFHNETLIDGELVIDSISIDGQSGDDKTAKQLSLYLFDLLTINGQSVMNLDLLQRFDKLWKGIMRPWESYYKVNPLLLENLPFKLVLKENFKSYHLGHVLKKIIPMLPHENDGLIFTPVTSSYVKGTCNELLKWKPGLLNTVDFNITPAEGNDNISINEVWELWAGDRGTNRFHGLFYLDFEKASDVGEDFLPKPGSIAELFWDPEWKSPIEHLGTYTSVDGGWRYLRLRTDKLTPNDIKVIAKINKSITHGCAEEDLIKMVPAIRDAWDKRPRS